MCGRSFGAIPGPVSLTRRALFDSDTETSPPGGVNLTALPTRFATSCAARPSSARDHDGGLDVGPKDDLLALREGSETLHLTADQQGQIDGLAVQGRGIEDGEPEQVVDELRAYLQLILGGGDVLLVLAGAQGQVELGVDDRERRAQLVTRVVRELREALEHALGGSQTAPREPQSEDRRQDRHEHCGDEEHGDLAGQLRRTDAILAGELQDDLVRARGSPWSARGTSCRRRAPSSGAASRGRRGDGRRCHWRRAFARPSSPASR